MQNNVKKNFYINILLSLILLFTVVYQFNNPNGLYYWLCNNLIKKNVEYIYLSNQNLTTDQKSSMKLGPSYDFLKLTKESTPENAIILFPPEHIFADPNNQVKFSGYMNRKGFVSYFLYPRKVVYETEIKSNPLYSRISHVAIVNAWGYDKLKYAVHDKIPYSVLALNQ